MKHVLLAAALAALLAPAAARAAAASPPAAAAPSAVSGGAPGAAPGAATGPLDMVSQNATYDLALARVRNHDITGATGQMRFSVLDACAGWAVSQRMTLLSRNADGSLTKTLSDYATFETKDGKTLSFVLKDTDDTGKTTVDDAGVATHTGADGAGTVVYSVPAGRVVNLPPGTLFPMAHTIALLKAGQEHRKFIAVPLFDGTDATGAQSTFVTVLSHDGPSKAAFKGLTAFPSTNVDIAFFDRKPADTAPNFSATMRYFDNGVADGLMLDFGDFVMRGKLATLDLPKSPACKK